MRPGTRRLVLAGLDRLQAVLVSVARAAGIVPFPIPPFSAMRRTTSRWLFHYYHSGLTTYLPIATAALREGIDLRASVRVLDFGVGAARQALHFTRHFPRPEYYACDVDPALVAFVARAYPQIRVGRNRFSPPLDYPDGLFDLVYSVSVFSHLSPADHLPWLRELYRIVRPGGICIVTVEGWTALARVARTVDTPADALVDELAAAGVVFRPYPSPTWAGGEGAYGSTLLSHEHIVRTWPQSGFQVAGILEGIINRRQDLVILRR